MLLGIVALIGCDIINSMKRISSGILFFFIILSSFLFTRSHSMAAADLGQLLNNAAVAYDTSAGAADPLAIVGMVIVTLLGFLGIAAAGYMIYGGYIWLMARGNEEEVKRGKKIIWNATVGMVIILSAYALSNFILSGIQTATQ